MRPASRRALVERREDLIRRRVVAGSLGCVRPQHVATGRDHEHTALLPAVALRAALAEPAAERADRADRADRVERLEHAALEAGGLVHLEARVGVDRPLPAGRLAEAGDEARRA